MSGTDRVRAEILSRLRDACHGEHALFHRGPPIPATTGPPVAVTHAEGGRAALARLFANKLEAISGSYEFAEDRAEAAQRVQSRIRDWHADLDGDDAPTHSALIQVLSWAPAELPVANLDTTLREAGIELVVPEDLHRRDARGRITGIDIGLTGADAAFAATGTLALVHGAGRSRVASLLPLRHIAIVPYSRICPTPEAWLGELRSAGRLRDILRESRQLVFVTGPSKSADIELNLTLGVHGPRIVHAVLFDDSPSREG